MERNMEIPNGSLERMIMFACKVLVIDTQLMISAC